MRNFMKAGWALMVGLMLGVLLCIPAASEETEIPEGYTAISSAIDLILIEDMTGNYILTQDIDMTDAEGWSLGCKANSSATTEFKGIFDGNGYSIFGLKNSTGFVYINSGTIKNLTIASGEIEKQGTSIGAFCCQNNGVIENCSNNITLRGAGGSYQRGYIGGICAVNYGVISCCVNNGSIYGENYTNASVGYGLFVGGIFGYSGNTATVVDCYNTGDIYITAEGFSSINYVGGIAGYASDTSRIENTYNIGMILTEVEMDAECIVGSIIGRKDSQVCISNCYYIETSAYSGAGDYAGLGIVSLYSVQMKVQGFYRGFDFDNVWCWIDGEYQYPVFRSMTSEFDIQPQKIIKKEISTAEDLLCIYDLSEEYILTQDIYLNDIKECASWVPIGYNRNTSVHEEFEGVIDGNGYTIYGMNDSFSLVYINSGTIKNLTVANGNWSGGVFCYRNNGTIKNCINIARVGGSTARAKISYVGGICSYNYGEILKCCNIGSINGSSYSNYDGVGCVYVGGIAGYCGENSIIKDCYNSGNIYVYAEGDSKYAYGYAGGIVGYTCSQEISNVYNVGNITISTFSAYGIQGGIIGKGVSLFTGENCHYLNTTATCGIGEGTIDDTTALYAAQMKVQGFYKGFDFENVWCFEDGDYPYPVFRKPVLLGDVNGDGTVDAIDNTILQYYFAGHPGYIITNETAADLNGDKSVTRADAMILARYFAEWDGYDDYLN